MAAGTAADVERAVDAAWRAQPGWARLAGADRAAVLHAIADAIEHDDDELMALERACTGKLPGSTSGR